MTRDDMRTGAGLIRALFAGDDSARYPLSDWIEANGIPYADGVALPRWGTPNGPGVLSTIVELRRGEPVMRRCVFALEHGESSVFIDAGYYTLWLGVWPTDVLEMAEMMDPSYRGG